MLGPGARLFIEAEIEFNVPDLPVVEVVPRISISHDIRRDFELRGSQARSLSLVHALNNIFWDKILLAELKKGLASETDLITIMFLFKARRPSQSNLESN